MALEAGQTAIKVRGSGFYVGIDIGSTAGNGQQVQLIILKQQYFISNQHDL